MAGFQKRLLAGAVASALAYGAAAGGAAAQEGAPDASEAERLETLMDQLAEPGREDWSRLEAEVMRLWSRSGSPAMDLLLRRARDAMEAQDFDAAVEHLSALTDHAPGFAEGWHARATAFYYLDEYSLSLADIERALALNPRHFGALEGLAAILEEMERPDLALQALRRAQEINPNRSSLQDSLERLERQAGAVEL